MPIRIRPNCRHCGKPVQQDQPIAPWYHSGTDAGEGNTLESRRCNPLDPNSNLAIPRIEVVKRGQE